MSNNLLKPVLYSRLKSQILKKVWLTLESSLDPCSEKNFLLIVLWNNWTKACPMMLDISLNFFFKADQRCQVYIYTIMLRRGEIGAFIYYSHLPIWCFWLLPYFVFYGHKHNQNRVPKKNMNLEESTRMSRK